MSRPIGIDLFSGAGGMSLGFEQAGFDVVASVEIDPIHAATHVFNFPRCTVLARSVVGLTGKKIREEVNLKDKKVDVVFGGAPCQGFSLIGQRALDDPRNRLVKEFIRIVKELDADYFVFENVKGLTLGKHRKFLDELISECRRKGYDVREDWKVLNSVNYGVPQNRQRLFLLGAKKGLQVPKYPHPVTVKPGANADALSAPTCFEALSDIPDAERFPELLRSDEVRVRKWGKPSAYARLMRCIVEEGWAFGYRREWDPMLLTSSLRTDHSDISRRRFSSTKPGKVEPISRFFKLPNDGISNTLRAGTDSARGAFTSPRPVHYQWDRCITVREMARLHGFPDWFRFHETKWHGARQIGNAVSPPVARAVGEEVLRAMGIRPVRPKAIVPLGDEALLRMDMSEASDYWGVEDPIGKRNLKSGIKKRRQFEVEAERLQAET